MKPLLEEPSAAIIVRRTVFAAGLDGEEPLRVRAAGLRPLRGDGRDNGNSVSEEQPAAVATKAVSNATVAPDRRTGLEC